MGEGRKEMEKFHECCQINKILEEIEIAHTGERGSGESVRRCDAFNSLLKWFKCCSQITCY